MRALKGWLFASLWLCSALVLGLAAIPVPPAVAQTGSEQLPHTYYPG